MFPAYMAMSRLLPVGLPAFRTASRLILVFVGMVNNKTMYNYLRHSSLSPNL